MLRIGGAIAILLTAAGAATAASAAGTAAPAATATAPAARRLGSLAGVATVAGIARLPAVIPAVIPAVLIATGGARSRRGGEGGWLRIRRGGRRLAVTARIGVASSIASTVALRFAVRARAPALA
jgi:hypothetical protein